MRGACFGRLVLVGALGVMAVPHGAAQAADPMLDAALLASNADYSAAVGMPLLGPEDDGAVPSPSGLSSSARLATQDGTIYSIELVTTADAASAAGLYEQLRALYVPSGISFELGDQSSATADGAVVQQGAQVLVLTLVGTAGPPPPGGIAPVAATAAEGMTGAGLEASGVRVPAGGTDPCTTPTDLVDGAFPGATAAWWRAERRPALECQFTTASGPVHVSVVSDTQLAASVTPGTVDELFDADLMTSVASGNAQEISGLGDRAFFTTQPNLIVEMVAPNAAGLRHLIRAIVPVPFAGPASEQEMLAGMEQLVGATHDGLDLPDADLPPVSFVSAAPPTTTAAVATTSAVTTPPTDAPATASAAPDTTVAAAPPADTAASATSTAPAPAANAPAATSTGASTDGDDDSDIVWLLVAGIAAVLVIGGLIIWWAWRRTRRPIATIKLAPPPVPAGVLAAPVAVAPRARGVADLGTQTVLSSRGGVVFGVRTAPGPVHTRVLTGSAPSTAYLNGDIDDDRA